MYEHGKLGISVNTSPIMALVKPSFILDLDKRGQISIQNLAKIWQKNDKPYSTCLKFISLK